MESYGPMGKASCIMGKDTFCYLKKHVSKSSHFKSYVVCEHLLVWTSYWMHKAEVHHSEQGKRGHPRSSVPGGGATLCLILLQYTHLWPSAVLVLCLYCTISCSDVMCEWELEMLKMDYVELNFHKWQKGWVLDWSLESLPTTLMVPVSWIIINQNTILLLPSII